MFTGPSIMTGRIAGRTVIADLVAGGEWTAGRFVRDDDMAPESVVDNARARVAESDAGALETLLAIPRNGYWHFEQVHQLVLERDYKCAQCHSGAVPMAAPTTRMQSLAQTATCDACHLAPVGTLDPTSHSSASDKRD
jgi:hypothetical protein